MLNGEQGVGPGDRFIAQTLATARVPVTIALNKVDRLSRAATLNGLVQAAELAPDAEVFPISARTGLGVEALLAHLFSMLPEGPFLLGADQASDQPLVLLLGELVREAAIKRTFQELPHAVEAEVAEISRPRAGLTRVEAALWVETESQKGILIGRGGSMVRAIGTAARRELERELGGHVQLDLAVRVRRHWRADEALLDRLQIS
jgi:GTPase